MSKADELQERLPEDKTVKRVIVTEPAPLNNSGIEKVEFRQEDVDSIIVTGSGSIFVATDGELSRYNKNRVFKIVYEDTGVSEDEEGEESDE